MYVGLESLGLSVDQVMFFKMFVPWMQMQISMVIYLSAGITETKTEEFSEETNPDPVLPELSYQILNADHLFLRDAARVLSGNFTWTSQTQPFIITGLSGKPAINVSYGPMSVEQAIPPEMIDTGPRIRCVILARQVRSSSPIIRLLFYAGVIDLPGWLKSIQNRAGYTCVTAHAVWKSREVRGTCSIPLNGGFCMAQLRPEPSWFRPGSSRSSREHRSTRGSPAELYFQTRPSPTSQCVPQDVGGSGMKKVGVVNLLRSPPGNLTFMRLRLGGAVIVQTSSKPLKITDMATFHVFLSSTSSVERFILRTTVQRGLSFSTARPSDTQLWDITLDPGKGGQTQTVSVTCQRKGSLTLKRGLLEVLQLDFDVREQGDLAQSQTLTWRLELPGETSRDEGSMRIYTMQRDYVGIAPLITDSEILNTAVLTGKKVSAQVMVLGVEADASVTEITESVSCASTDEDILKVSETCDYVYVNGKETRGRTKTTVNFTYSYLSAQLEVSVWMPRLPLQIDLADPELSQIKGWRVPVSSSKRVSWESDEDEERKSRSCMVQYQHSPLRVLTAFTAESPDSDSSRPLYFLGPDWLVDVTRLVRYSLRVRDVNVARLHRGTVISGRSPGVTAVQVASPLSDLVLGERTVRVLDDKVSITDLGVQLVSGLSLSLQLSPGSDRAIVATATTQNSMHNPKQEAAVSCWLRFSDGTRLPLDLFDASGYVLTLSSLDTRVVSVRRIPSAVVVAEDEGWGAVLTAELTVSESCQKSKRRSKLAGGSGNVVVKFAKNSKTGMIPKPTLSYASLQETTEPTFTDKPGTEQLLIFGNNLGNLIDSSNKVEAKEEPVEEPKEESPKTPAPNLLTDVEIWIYLFLAAVCLAIITFLLKCTSQNARPGTMGSMQCQPDNTHHWVRLGTPAEQSRTVPVATAVKPGPPASEMSGVEERTATLGRRSSTLPSRTTKVLQRPTRTEPLHSPTSKRNQVQFTTFTTLDIKHLAALKRNWLEFTWNQGGTTDQEGRHPGTNNEGGKDDVPWPVVKPVPTISEPNTTPHGGT